jgi:arsenate reductase
MVRAAMITAALGWTSCGGAGTTGDADDGGSENTETMEVVNANPWRHVDGYIAERIAEFDQIGAQRRVELEAIAAYVGERHAHGLLARLTFVCTHNSRRSQLAQVWSEAAVHYYGVDSVLFFSGGTKRTSFNQRAIGALRRAGMEIRPARLSDNPRYRIQFAGDAEPMISWSKLIHDPKNPEVSFAAVMTCTEAETDCPVVQGAERRLGLAYDDPKIGDGTAGEVKLYDVRCAQIAREMFYVMSQVVAEMNVVAESGNGNEIAN